MFHTASVKAYRGLVLYGTVIPNLRSMEEPNHSLAVVLRTNFSPTLVAEPQHFLDLCYLWMKTKYFFSYWRHICFYFFVFVLASSVCSWASSYLHMILSLWDRNVWRRKFSSWPLCMIIKSAFFTPVLGVYLFSFTIKIFFSKPTPLYCPYLCESIQVTIQNKRCHIKSKQSQPYMLMKKGDRNPRSRSKTYWTEG